MQINAWFIANRDPKTGEYPDLPSEEEGGSKTILNPLPPSVESLLAAQAEAAAAKGGKGSSKPAAAKPSAWRGQGGGHRLMKVCHSFGIHAVAGSQQRVAGGSAAQVFTAGRCRNRVIVGSNAASQALSRQSSWSRFA
jgi:hypothetical protein